MPKFGNRVKETTDTTGTGTIDLSGAPTGFRSFADEFTSGDADISYLIVDDPDNPTDYEYGKGTFTTGTPNTLARNTVEGSSNAGAKVSFSAGTKTVIATPTAADFDVFGGDGPWAAKTAIVRSITATGSMLAADDGKLILADGSANSPPGLTYNLLAAATAGDGFAVWVINTGSSGSVVIDPSGAETVNGASTLAISGRYGIAFLRCDGTAWYASPDPGVFVSSRGGILTRGASALQELALGATQLAPISNGTDLIFDEPRGFRPLTAPQTLSSTASIEVDVLDGYHYMVDIVDAIPSVDGARYDFHTFESGAYVTSSSYTSRNLIDGTVGGSGSTTGIEVGASVGSGAGEGMHATIVVSNPGSATYRTRVNGHGLRYNTSGSPRKEDIEGARNSAVAATKFRIIPDSGNFASGMYQVFRRPTSLAA